jgi:hypothetical protein
MQQPFKRHLFSVIVGGLVLTASFLLIGCGDDDDNNAVSATASELANTQFEFSDGAAFGFANEPVAMSYGDFTGNTGTFALTSASGTASGTVTLGSCNHLVQASTYLSLVVGTQINCAVCEIEPNGAMFVTCGEGENQTSSSSTGAGTSSIPADTGSTGSGGGAN